ncbi:hypothetical protein D3C85_1911330 [compost metagenome]
MAFAAGHSAHDIFTHVLFEECASIRMENHFSVAIHHKKLALNRGHHLTQRIAHNGQVEMESQCSLEFPFR